MPSPDAGYTDGAPIANDEATYRDYVVQALRSAWPPPDPIPVAPWIVDSFWEGRVAPMVAGNEDIAPSSRDQTLVELARGLVEAVVDFIRANGYLALSDLEVRLDDLRGTLSDEAYTLELEAGARTAKLRQLQALTASYSGDADGRSRLPHDAVIITERRLMQVGEHKLNRVRLMEWGLWTEDGVPQYDAAELIVGTRNEESEDWGPELEGDYTRGPVPLNEWMRDQSEMLGVDLEQPHGLDATIDEVQREAEERRVQLDRRLDVVELRLAVVKALKDEVERFGADPHALLTLTSDKGSIELTEAVDGHAMRRHVRLLHRSGIYVAVRAAMLVHEGRAPTWASAHALLKGDVRATDPDATLAYEKTRNLTDALSSTYEVDREKARERGVRAFKPHHQRTYRALSEGRREPPSED